MDDEAQDIQVPQPADADGAHVNQDQPVVQAPPDAPAAEEPGSRHLPMHGGGKAWGKP